MPLRWKYLVPHFRRTEEREMQRELQALTEIAGRRELGNLTLAAENTRAVWGWTRLDGLLADIRYAFRTLLRQPVFPAVAVLSLALGIGANAAIFSLMDALLWRDLPVRDPQSLVIFANGSRSYFGFTRFAEGSGDVMESVMAASSIAPARPLDTGGSPERGAVSLVSGNFFQGLGVTPELGRAIIPADDRRGNPALVAVLSHAYWQQAYGGQPVLGRTIRVDKMPFTIVGVAPPEFFGITVGDRPNVWVPVTATDSVFPGSGWLDHKSANFLTIIGRLRPGVSRRDAADALTPVGIQIDIERNGKPPNDADRRSFFESQLQLAPAAKGFFFLGNRFSGPLWLVFWMVAIGLLLACVNVMSLGFARACERRKELTVRLAIGAGRWRIARQLLTESMIIALASGLIGIAIRKPLAQALVRLISWGDQPVRLDLSIHSGILLFVVAVSVAAALVSGVAPAMRATRGELLSGLQQGSRSATPAPLRRTVGRLAVAAQMALSLVLVSGACLFAGNLHQLRHFDSGVNRDRLLVLDVDLAGAGYKDAQMVPLNLRLRDRLAAVPGVRAVSFSQNGLYSYRNFSTEFYADGYPPTDPRGHSSILDLVGPRFFTTAGDRIVAGRDFDEHDDAGAPKVAIVTSEFARRVFDGENAIGRNLYVYTAPQTTESYRIVGVVQDIRNDVRQKQPMFYLCQLQTQVHFFSTAFLVRTRIRPSAVIPGLRAAVRAEDPALPIDQIDSADDLFDRTLSTDRLIATLAWGFGVLAITLAAVGIYGLLSYDVTRRTAEIGIRIALGARTSDVLRLVMKDVARVSAIGLTAGAMAALAVSKMLQGLLFQIEPLDPRMELAAALILAAVAIAAAWIPARRAVRMEPMAALRNE